jgi:hypothetical protein
MYKSFSANVFYNARGLSVRTTPLGSTPFGNEKKKSAQNIKISEK